MGVIYPNAGYAAANAVDITPAAKATENIMRSYASQHVELGELVGGIHTERESVKSVTHHHIIATHEHISAIEWGHVASNGRWVDGIHVVTRTYASMGGR